MADFHEANHKLFAYVEAELSELVSSLGLRLTPPMDHDGDDEGDGVSEYGAVFITDKEHPMLRWFNFGLGWDQDTNQEIQFFFRWLPHRRMTVIETDNILDFEELVDAVKDRLPSLEEVEEQRLQLMRSPLYSRGSRGAAPPATKAAGATPGSTISGCLGIVGLVAATGLIFSLAGGLGSQWSEPGQILANVANVPSSTTLPVGSSSEPEGSAAADATQTAPVAAAANPNDKGGNGPVAISTSDGETLRVRDFLHDPSVTMQEGQYYVLAEVYPSGVAPVIGVPPAYGIQYYPFDSSFGMFFSGVTENGDMQSEEELGRMRRIATMDLRRRLAISASELCLIRINVGISGNRYHPLAGRELGLPNCPRSYRFPGD